jgi:putative hydrolase of the HAD superfamily
MLCTLRPQYAVFDLDETLYPSDSGLMQEVGRRIQSWLQSRLKMSEEEARRMRRYYFGRYGTTLGGLLAECSVDAADYLDYVHDIPVDRYLRPDPALREMLLRMPLRKVVFSNATVAHCGRVLETLGIADVFERIVGVEEVGLQNKLVQSAYVRALDLFGASGPECVMIEDSVRNLRAAKAVGMTTVLVGGEAEAFVDWVVDGVVQVGQVVNHLLS